VAVSHGQELIYSARIALVAMQMDAEYRLVERAPASGSDYTNSRDGEQPK
jgi:hypothetical protein